MSRPFDLFGPTMERLETCLAHAEQDVVTRTDHRVRDREFPKARIRNKRANLRIPEADGGELGRASDVLSCPSSHRIQGLEHSRFAVHGPPSA